jgi:hypothetical protein
MITNAMINDLINPNDDRSTITVSAFRVLMEDLAALTGEVRLDNANDSFFNFEINGILSFSDFKRYFLVNFYEGVAPDEDFLRIKTLINGKENESNVLSLSDFKIVMYEIFQDGAYDLSTGGGE